jgi:hypothetical protein
VPRAVGEFPGRHTLEMPERDPAMPQAVRGAARQASALAQVAHRRTEAIRAHAGKRRPRTGSDVATISITTWQRHEPDFARALPTFPVDGPYPETQARRIDVVPLERNDFADSERPLLEDDEGISTCSEASP